MYDRTHSVPIPAMIDGPSALDLANARKSSFHSSFRRTITKVLCSAWGSIAIAVRQVTPALLWKKERTFSKNTRGHSRSSQKKKLPGDGAEFSKRPQRHCRNQKPQSLNAWRQIFQKRGKQKKTLFETDITLERKKIISSCERKSSLESLAQNIPGWPSPSHARNLSFTHDGYIRHTATEMILLMTDISVIWQSTG